MKNRPSPAFTPPPFLPGGRPAGRSVYDAVEECAVKHQIRRTQIWEIVLLAYGDGTLSIQPRGGIGVPDGWSLNSIIDNSIRGALAALAREDFQTAHWDWIRCLAADDKFHQWLAMAITKSPILSAGAGGETTLPKKRHATQRDAALRALAELYPDRRPLATIKVIRSQINEWLRKQGGSDVSEDTVSRALREFRPN